MYELFKKHYLLLWIFTFQGRELCQVILLVFLNFHIFGELVFHAFHHSFKRVLSLCVFRTSQSWILQRVCVMFWFRDQADVLVQTQLNFYLLGVDLNERDKPLVESQRQLCTLQEHILLFQIHYFY